MTETVDPFRLWTRAPAGGAFAVWAPGAASVRLRVGDGPSELLTPDATGWQRADRGLPAAPARYGLELNGDVLPDPASRAQPDGPAGLSASVPDGSAFPWTDAAWRGRPWYETVLYELHVGTFTADGTYAAAADRLEHLVHLGVTMIELMPVGEFAGARNWGYDGVLLFAPFHGYGTPDDLRRLVDRCHALGLSVVLDVVFNHFGPAANTVARLAPEFFTEKHETPWGGAIDFAQPAVRAYFISNALYWIEEFHLDGLRLDAVQAVFDDSPQHILDEIAERVHAAAPGRPVHLTLENDNNDRRWLERDAAGATRHYAAQWNDDFHHVMRVLVAGRTDGYYRDYAQRPLERLGRALTEGFSYQGETESIHRPGLWRGTPSAHLPPVAFVNFLQNHDQVGNTPFGHRLSDLAEPATLRLGVAITLLGPAIPMLFMGEEWAAAQPFHFFCDYEGELADAVRTGRREEFQHLPEFSDPAQVARLTDPNAASTRDACVLDWAARERAPHAEWLRFYGDLLAIRRERIVPLLPLIAGAAGRYRVDGTVLHASWALTDGRRLHLGANFSDAPVSAEIEGDEIFRLGDDAAGLAAWGLRIALHN